MRIGSGAQRLFPEAAGCLADRKGHFLCRNLWRAEQSVSSPFLPTESAIKVDFPPSAGEVSCQ